MKPTRTENVEAHLASIRRHADGEAVSDGLLLLVRHGSHAYGTTVPGSDLDLRGVTVPPRRWLLSFRRRFEQLELDEPDAVIYGARKFFKLAARNNPNILELLFVHPEDLLYVSEAGQRLLARRQSFLSRKVRHTFCGYANSQIRRIETHRKYLLDPPVAPPSREEFGLPERSLIPRNQRQAAEAAVRQQLDRWDLDLEALDPADRIAVREELESMLTEMSLHGDDRWRASARAVGLDDNFIEILGREKRFKAARNNWRRYQSWKEHRNPARAELEARYGYDTKHGMHLVRLLRMALEMLRDGELKVRRPDAEELVAIRRGAFSYEELIAESERLIAEIEEIADGSPLPERVDPDMLDELCIEVCEEQWSSSFGAR